MNSETDNRNAAPMRPQTNSLEKADHPAWIAFISYCIELDHGEIEILRIQNGLPVLAEVTRKKVKF
jgi:hypothetical protein